MKRFTITTVLTILFLVVVGSAQASPQLTGRIASNFEYSLVDKQLEQVNQFELQLSGGSSLGWWTADLKIDDKQELSLGECFAVLYLDNTDVTIGRQRIVWGEADGLRPTDIINPLDLSNVFAKDNRIPVTALRFQHYFRDWTVDAVWVPTFVPIKIEGLDVFAVEEPGKGVDSSQQGVRISKRLPGLDLAASYYYGLDPIPWIDLTTMTGGYQRYHMFGIDLAKDFGSFVLRSEAAYFDVEEAPLGKSDYLQYVIGLDWRLSELYVNVQFLGEYQFAGTEREDNSGHQTALGLALTYELDTYKRIGVTTYYGLTDKDIMVNPELIWDIADGINFCAGCRLFAGDLTTQMGQFKDQDHVYVGISMSF